MKNLNKQELLDVKGGNISGTIISAFSRAVNSIMELGRSLGDAIRRIQNGNLC